MLERAKYPYKPNVRKHPLDEYEKALVDMPLTDDGKLPDEEAADRAAMLASVFIVIAAVGIVVCSLWLINSCGMIG